MFPGDPPFLVHVGGGSLHHLHRLQAADHHHQALFRPVSAARLCGLVNIRCPAHCGFQQRGSRHAVTPSHGGQRVAACQGGKAEPGTVARVTAHAPLEGLCYTAMAVAQCGCPAVTKAVSSLSLRIQRVNIAGVEVICDVSRGAARPVVPAAFQRTVFAAVHGLVHPGIRAKWRMISRRFVWHGCAADVSRWCRDCQECQHLKVTRQLAAATQATPVPEKRFSHLHVDLVGPLPTSPDGFKYIFTIIDHSTMCFEAVPVKNMEVTVALVTGLICRFGVPAAVTSDRGTLFTSAVWRPCARSWASNTSPPQLSTLAAMGWWREHTPS